MEKIFGNLSVFYSCLLIIEIILVSIVSFLLLLKMIFRMKAQEEFNKNQAQRTIQEMQTIEELKQNLTDAKIQLEKMNFLIQENEQLKNKIQIYESKLKEYEILQEEIGTIRTLQIENQKLKDQLSSAKTGTAPIQNKSEEATIVNEADIEALLGQVNSLVGRETVT